MPTSSERQSSVFFVPEMKVKELQKTVNVAWSPAQQQSILLAAGTAAQQLDASSSAVLEIYEANLSEPGYDLVLKSSQTSPYRLVCLLYLVNVL